MHEIAAYVHLQHVGSFLVVERGLTDMMFEAVDAIVCATALDAAVAVGDEGALEHLVGVVEVEVMHNAVAKVGGKDLAFLRVFDEEAGRWAWFVATFVEFVGKFLEVLMEVGFEFQLVLAETLVTTCVDVSRIEVKIESFAC